MGTKSCFSSRLKALREEKGLTQSQLADKLGVSRGSISFYENDDRTPDVQFLLNASRFFSVSCDWLLGSVDVKPLAPQLNAICRYTGLSDDAVIRLHNELSVRNGDSGCATLASVLSSIIVYPGLGESLLLFIDEGISEKLRLLLSDTSGCVILNDGATYRRGNKFEPYNYYVYQVVDWFRAAVEEYIDAQVKSRVKQKEERDAEEK